MEMLGRVRRMYFRDKLNRSEIARRTGLSRNTVKKWLKAEGRVTPVYQRSEVPRKLSPFEPWLIQALRADAQRPKKGKRSINLMLFAHSGVGDRRIRIRDRVFRFERLRGSIID